MLPYCEEYPLLAKSNTLFIHGNLASSRWWHPMLSEWRRARSLGSGSLLFTDWRGCGQNPDWPIEQNFTLEDLARDFLELLNRRGMHNVALVGHSLGGLIALQMMILEPQRFTKAFLLDPVGEQGVVFDDAMYEAFKQMANSPELTRTVILSTIRNAENLAPDFANQIATDAYKAVRGIGTSVLEILKTVNLSEEAHRLSIPTLIVHGAHDQVIPLSDSDRLSRRLLKGQLEVREESGHCWNVEAPASFTERLRAWL